MMARMAASLAGNDRQDACGKLSTQGLYQNSVQYTTLVISNADNGKESAHQDIDSGHAHGHQLQSQPTG
jgi:hypothetical protein